MMKPTDPRTIERDPAVVVSRRLLRRARFMLGDDARSAVCESASNGIVRPRSTAERCCANFPQPQHPADFDRVDPGVMPIENQAHLKEVLRWYRETHPVWFSWLDVP